ncbi:hypothetical protein BpHYR1_037151 [Brachionus plicatilis]|uniref:Uncharacterized protein n=1 Tax=Brachionus plicatilis TaxID=10195 RepID=A0A3M7TCI5_BRAPC|nr:hypothetical protein BpHYR1_037151 [Brachionus plicatilis]
MESNFKVCWSLHFESIWPLIIQAQAFGKLSKYNKHNYFRRQICFLSGKKEFNEKNQILRLSCKQKYPFT